MLVELAIWRVRNRFSPVAINLGTVDWMRIQVTQHYFDVDKSDPTFDRYRDSGRRWVVLLDGAPEDIAEDELLRLQQLGYALEPIVL